MELFERILKTAVEGGASDVHLKVGTPVIFRINRQLIAIECPYPTQEWINKIVELVTPDDFHSASLPNCILRQPNFTVTPSANEANQLVIGHARRRQLGGDLRGGTA